MRDRARGIQGNQKRETTNIITILLKWHISDFVGGNQTFEFKMGTKRNIDVCKLTTVGKVFHGFYCFFSFSCFSFIFFFFLLVRSTFIFSLSLSLHSLKNEIFFRWLIQQVHIFIFVDLHMKLPKKEEEEEVNLR